MKDSYLYQDIDVLRNKFDIKNKDILDRTESNISAVKLTMVDQLLEIQIKDFKYLKKIHEFLFEDIYEWAGRERTINIYKNEEVLSGESVEYENYKNIEKRAEQIIGDMDKIQWNKLNSEEQAKRFSKYITDLWKVHTFREGNTRTIMTFAAHYALEHGFSLNRILLSEYHEYTRNAMVVATVDSTFGGHIEKIFKDSIQKGDLNYFISKLASAGFEPTSQLIGDIRKVNQQFGRNISIKEIRDICKQKEKLSEQNREFIEIIEKDFKEQEIRQKEKNRKVEYWGCER